MAHYMHKFPIGCVCGQSIWVNDLANNGGCQNCDQQVHVAAMELIKVLEQFPALHDTILASDCLDEIARCIKGTVPPKPTTDKPPLFLEASRVIKSLLSTSDPSTIENDDNDGDTDNNNKDNNHANETPGEQQSPRNPKIKTEPQS